MKIENFDSTLRAFDEPSSSLEHFKNMTSLHVLLGGRFLRGLMARAADHGRLELLMLWHRRCQPFSIDRARQGFDCTWYIPRGEKLQTGIFSMLQESIEYGGHLNKYIIT